MCSSWQDVMTTFSTKDKTIDPNLTQHSVLSTESSGLLFFSSHPICQNVLFNPYRTVITNSWQAYFTNSWQAKNKKKQRKKQLLIIGFEPGSHRCKTNAWAFKEASLALVEFPQKCSRHGISNPPCGKSWEYLLVDVTSHCIEEPSCSRNKWEIFFGRWLTTSFAFFMAIAFLSWMLFISTSQAKTSLSHTSLYTWYPHTIALIEK